MGLRSQKPLAPPQKRIVSPTSRLGGSSDPYQFKGVGASPFTQRDIKWTPVTAILAAIFVGCPYVVAIMWTVSSGLNFLAVILVVAAIVIAIVFFLMFYLTRL